MPERFRKFVVGVVVAACLLAAVSGYGVASLASSPTPPDDFATPSSATPTPIPDREAVTSCSGETCNGTDPQKTGCALPENGSYTQTQVEVRDEQGAVLGNLLLRANDRGCDSTQWAQFRDLTRPLTFELRLVQNHTGASTQPVRMENWQKDTWTMQLHSPVERMRAEVVVYDENGKVIASVVTESY